MVLIRLERDGTNTDRLTKIDYYYPGLCID
jgi:hypothetical protein